MTIEEKAEEYRKSLKQRLIDNDEFERLEKFDENVEEAYITGAKENGVVWHNLKENPNDLPKDHYIKQAYNYFDGYVRAWYNEEKDEWISENGLKHYHGSIEQWCELPIL